MASSHEPLVSVVTPVYNGEQHLRDCIESVLSQSYPHWDYTIVNNCSTDRTLEIAREYAARDTRIRIRSNETFVPVIQNYNNAFRECSAQSKYCKVVAADDWLFPDCIERMVRLAEDHPTVAIVGAYGLDGTNVLWTGMPYPSTVVPGREACRALLLGGPYVFGTPTAVLYKSEIVRSRHAFYNESNLHADAEVCLEFLDHCDFGFVHQVLTFNRVREESFTTYSKKLQTYLPNKLYDLITYGPKYLSEAELKDRTRIRLQAYYQYLGAQVYERRNREFWDFHRRSLAKLGYRLRWWRVATAAVSRGLELMVNPKRLVKAAVRRYQNLGRFRETHGGGQAISEAPLLAVTERALVSRPGQGSIRGQITIVICTVNRCSSLADTLTSLERMQVPDHLRWNILVVDNNSTDGTRAMVEEFARNARIEVTYLFEPEQGLSRARNRGILATDSEYVAFTDDDVLVDQNWLKNIAEAFATYDADCVGGKIVPYWLSQRPGWLSDRLLNVLAVLDHGERSFQVGLRDDRVLYGANFAFKRESLVKRGMFNIDLGRKGKLGSGEDKEVLEKLRWSNGRIVYAPTVVVFHKVPAERLTKAYFRRWHYQAGKDRAKLTTRSRFTVFGIESYLFRDFLRTTLRLLGSILGRERDRLFEYELRCITYLSVFKHKLAFRRSSR